MKNHSIDKIQRLINREFQLADLPPAGLADLFETERKEVDRLVSDLPRARARRRLELILADHLRLSVLVLGLGHTDYLAKLRRRTTEGERS